MKARLIRGKTSGQSLPLIALMIVVLVAMVGLAVDVGNTYAAQRNTVRATNAAALAGMTNLINGGSDDSVYTMISQSLVSNGIAVAARNSQPGPGERTLVANYLDASGNPIAACPNVGSCGSVSPSQLGVTYIRVNVVGQVDTYFARVVGRDTLPVGADAYASRGACTSGIYPITLRDTYLNENGFVNPDSIYNDNIYRNKTMKRVVMKDDTNPNGGFDWVKWLDGPTDGNSTALTAMLTGGGNIDQGFVEAPWPTNNNLNLPRPNGYPIQPHTLNPGDWIYGNSGVSNDTDVRAQLDFHIKNRTVMILPIHDTDDGGGVNGNYHVSRLGAFLLRGYELNGHGYFDLVYLGNGGECATLNTPAAHPTSLGITGQVLYRPRNKSVPASRPPVEYEIILDVSGSMSWNYAGQTGSSSHPTQCTGVVYTSPCDGGWSPTSERRIYIAKQAIKSFIDQMQPNDSMRIVAFSGNLNSNYGDQNAINNLTHAYPTTGWSSDHTALKDGVDCAGAGDNTPPCGNFYSTNGRTPSATGISAGNQALAAAPAQAPDGQTYKRVVIFLTDGVANVLKDGKAPTYTGSCGSEIATCNTGTVNGVPMPITAMGLAADSLKQLATIYVIALAGVDETGLTNVASAPSYPFFSSSENGNDLAGIFANIATNVKYGDCVPAGGNTWATTIDRKSVV